MAKDDIPVKESTHGGVPVTDVRSAQAALHGMMNTPQEEQSTEDQEETEPQEEVSAQDTESESVETEAEKPEGLENPDGLTAEDLVDQDQEVETETPNVYTIKVDGKDVEVTLEELQNGYSRQADYTRKSQVLAEQRKLADDELAATQQERQRYSQALEQLGDSTDYEISQFANVDWNKLKSEDPMAFMQQKDALRDLQDSKRKLADEKARIAATNQKDYEANLVKARESQIKILTEKLPEWVDPVKGTKLKSDVKNFAMTEGFSEQEIDMLMDARSIKVLNDARKYNELLKSKISKKKQKVVPKMQKPGTPQTKEDNRSDKIKAQRARLRKTGHVNDAKSVIESIMKS
tara:strand:+ start:3601 stop:4647 length:1047 start_codon:yes stop_codon:yes gene_type:complete